MRTWTQGAGFVFILTIQAPAALHAQAVDIQPTEDTAVFGSVTEAILEEEFRRNREALRASPKFAEEDALSHVRRGEVLHHRGDLTGAAEEFQAAIRLRPQLGQAHRGLGAIRMDQHDWGGAVEALDAAIRVRPDDAEAYYWLGRALMAQRKWTAAVGALRKATELNPDDAEAYADLGLVRMAEGDLSEADEVLRIAIRLKPHNADAHHLLDILQANRDNPEEVARAANRILDTWFARE